MVPIQDTKQYSLSEKKLFANSFCNSFVENITHLFCDCTITHCLWKKLQLKLKDNITILPLTPPPAIFSFLEADSQSYLIQNLILLISKQV